MIEVEPTTKAVYCKGLDDHDFTITPFSEPGAASMAEAIIDFVYDRNLLAMAKLRQNEEATGREDQYFILRSFIKLQTSNNLTNKERGEFAENVTELFAKRIKLENNVVTSNPAEKDHETLAAVREEIEFATANTPAGVDAEGYGKLIKEFGSHKNNWENEFPGAALASPDRR